MAKMDTILTNTNNLQNNQRKTRLWRPNSVTSLSKLNGRSNSVLDTISKIKHKAKIYDRNWDTIITIVLVEAKCIPPATDDGVPHTLYCKIGLGPETFKSKSVPSSQHPEWRERFQLHLYQNYELTISLWDKGKMKNTMGSCILDLSNFEKERTHEVWQQLDDGYGMIHISVTMCAIRSQDVTNNCFTDLRDYNMKHDISSISCDWSVVGILHVNVMGGKGFTSKPNAFCTLELDNERIETHRAGPTCEPRWNKCYAFKVYDVTSTLDLKVHDSSVTNTLLNESLGKVSIPLLRINNGLMRWYGLKDRNKRNNAKGNCPRIRLQMSMVWNPIKATVRLFQPKEVRYVKKPPKFDLALIYSNVKYVAVLLNIVEKLNEYYKSSFEWDDIEYSFCALMAWLVLCYYLTVWSIPFILFLAFLYQWIFCRRKDNIYVVRDYANDDIQEEKSFTGKLQDLQKLTLTIKYGIDFIVSYIERCYNLFTFKVPFLSVVTMTILLAASAGLYLIPFNYFLMALGIYKFMRKYLNQDRVSNNNLLDFLSRVPDNEILKDWRELTVPEPNQEFQRHPSKLPRSISSTF